jgi:hypothetical protein
MAEVTVKWRFLEKGRHFLLHTTMHSASIMRMNVGILSRRSNKVCILTAALRLRNFARGIKISKVNGRRVQRIEALRPLYDASHQGLGDSPDATLLHGTLPLAGSGNRLEPKSQAELNLPGSSSAGQASNYSEAASPIGCPW